MSSKTYQDSVKLLGTAQAQHATIIQPNFSIYIFTEISRSNPTQITLFQNLIQDTEIVKSDEVKLTKIYTAVEKF